MKPNLPNKSIPESYSIYLDAFRFGAAIFVLLFHMKKHSIGSPGLLSITPDRGHDFVILFFVLSGLVITATAERKKTLGIKQFFIERASRVYSVAIPALFISTILALCYGHLSKEYLPILLNFFFLGQVGLEAFYPFWNQPFWSLCYEVMYYAIFGCFIFLGGFKRVFWILAIMVIAGPKVLLLMPCWLFGVVIYYWRDKWPLAPITALILAFIVPAIIAIILNKLHFGEHVRALISDLLGNQYKAFAFSNYFLADYVTAFIVSLHLYAMRYVSISWPATIERFVKAGASMSFTLYLTHLPLIFIIENLVSNADRSALLFWFSLISITLICWVISLYTEQKRPILTKAISKVIN